MFYRLIQRHGARGQHTFAPEHHHSLCSARQKATTLAADYLIEDCFGNPIEYRISVAQTHPSKPLEFTFGL